MNSFIRTLAILSIPLTLVGCGLEQDAKDNAEATLVSIDTMANQVAEREAAINTILSGSDGDFFRVYAERENWSTDFIQAKDDLERAREIYTSSVIPILDRNKGGEEDLLQTEVDRVLASITRARDKSMEPSARANFLRDARVNAPNWVAEAEERVGEMRNTITALREFREGAQSDYPGRADDIASRLAPSEKLFRDSTEALALAQAELQNLEEGSEEADYAILGDNTRLVGTNLTNLRAENTRYRNTIGELYRDYSRTLIDMRTDYFIQVGRTSWDNWSDWNTDSDYIYPEVQVDEATFEYWDELAENTTVASGNRSSARPSIDQAMWSAAGVVTSASWPSSHDAAEYWVNNTFARYFHRYELTEGGDTTTTDWEEVSEQVFDDQWENMGMTIVAKPQGMFEDEVLDDATPPGLAFVDNPRYGEWRQDSSGNSFWAFYGQYAFFSNMLGMNNHYYYRSDYDDWNRNYRGRGSYYGSGGNWTYGTYSRNVSTSPRYRGSTFGRQGGFQSAAAERPARSSRPTTTTSARGTTGSVRGAGASTRGGGPGGGGK